MRAMSSEPSNRKRRWFQFSLRSLLVIVTLFCVIGGWLGNEYRIVRARKALVQRIFENGNMQERWGIVFYSPTINSSGQKSDGWAGIGFVPNEAMTSLTRGGGQSRPSIVRRWLGDSDQRICVICIPASAETAETTAASELFPEARIYRSSEAEIALLLSGRGRGAVVLRALPLTPADREHLARYYKGLAADSRSSPSPDRN